MQVKSEILEVPVFVAEFAKSEAANWTLAGLVAHYRHEIESHPYARFIGLFDHYAHTRALPDGEVAEGIVNAVNVVFCFGMAIPDPEVLALRPRSIGITELADRYVIAFLEPPMPLVNTAMEAWTMKLQQALGDTSAAAPPSSGDAWHA